MPLPAALLVAGSLLTPISDTVPNFDPAPGCRQASLLMAMSADAVAKCIEQENATKRQLSTVWTQYPAGTRNRCVETTHIEGDPSYVEIMACLTMGTNIRPSKLPE